MFYIGENEMIRYIVAWNIKPEYSLQEAKKIKIELENLKNQISEILEIKVVIDIATSSDRSIVLTSLFNSVQDLQAYQVDPTHVKVSNFVTSITQDRVCLDYIES